MVADGRASRFRNAAINKRPCGASPKSDRHATLDGEPIIDLVAKDHVLPPSSRQSARECRLVQGREFGARDDWRTRCDDHRHGRRLKKVAVPSGDIATGSPWAWACLPRIAEPPRTRADAEAWDGRAMIKTRPMMHLRIAVTACQAKSDGAPRSIKSQVRRRRPRLSPPKGVYDRPDASNRNEAAPRNPVGRRNAGERTHHRFPARGSLQTSILTATGSTTVDWTKVQNILSRTIAGRRTFTIERTGSRSSCRYRKRAIRRKAMPPNNWKRVQRSGG